MDDLNHAQIRSAEPDGWFAEGLWTRTSTSMPPEQQPARSRSTAAQPGADQGFILPSRRGVASDLPTGSMLDGQASSMIRRLQLW